MIGSPDSGHPYAAAVFSDHELCSGVFLDSQTLVTAAHCFADGSIVQATFGRVTHPAGVFTTTDPSYAGTVHDDPSFCFGCGNNRAAADTGDIAVVKFASPVPVSRFASLPALGQDDTLPGNQAIDVVGYGASAVSKGVPTAFGTRQVATVKLGSAGSLSNEFIKLSADPGSCVGDSGGPNLIGGTDTLVAINSFSEGNPNCNGDTFSERLDTQAAQGFIASVR